MNDLFYIKQKFKEIKNLIPKQDHDYILQPHESHHYSNGKCGLYFKCVKCNCMLIYTVYGSFKFNYDFFGDISNDTEEISKFLTCSQVVIKNIIE